MPRLSPALSAVDGGGSGRWSPGSGCPSSVTHPAAAGSPEMGQFPPPRGPLAISSAQHGRICLRRSWVQRLIHEMLNFTEKNRVSPVRCDTFHHE